MFLIDLIRPDRIIHRSVQSAGVALAPAAELFEEILGRGSSLRVRVTGSSMTSFINDGEFVVIMRVPGAQFKTGDIVFCKDHNRGYVLHRIIKKRKQGDGRYLFQTKGDAVMGYDTPVFGEDILGRIHKIERIKSGSSLKVIDLQSINWRLINHLLAVIHRFRSEFYFKIYSPLKTGHISR